MFCSYRRVHVLTATLQLVQHQKCICHTKIIGWQCQKCILVLGCSFCWIKWWDLQRIVHKNLKWRFLFEAIASPLVTFSLTRTFNRVFFLHDLSVWDFIFRTLISVYYNYNTMYFSCSKIRYNTFTLIRHDCLLSCMPFHFDWIINKKCLRHNGKSNIYS